MGYMPYHSYFNTVLNQFLSQLRMLSRKGSPDKLVGSGTCLSQTFSSVDTTQLISGAEMHL